MEFLRPKIKTAIISLFFGSIVSWFLKELLTPIIFSGMTFEGRSKFIQTGLFFFYAFIFSLFFIFPAKKLLNPLSKIGSYLGKKITSFLSAILRFVRSLNRIVYFYLFTSLFILGNVFLVTTNLSNFPQNIQLQHDDLPELIQISNYSETENFAFGKFTHPQNMDVFISPEITKWTSIDIERINEIYKPFNLLKLSNDYSYSLNSKEFSEIREKSQYRTWRQINGNLYYYFLPIQSPQKYYIAKYGSDIVFLPDSLYDSIKELN